MHIVQEKTPICDLVNETENWNSKYLLLSTATRLPNYNSVNKTEPSIANWYISEAKKKCSWSLMRSQMLSISKIQGLGKQQTTVKGFYDKRNQQIAQAERKFKNSEI